MELKTKIYKIFEYNLIVFKRLNQRIKSFWKKEGEGLFQRVTC